jgi:hypothetical protein
MLGTGCPAASWITTLINGSTWSGLQTNRISFNAKTAPWVGVDFTVLVGRSVFVAFGIGIMAVIVDVAVCRTSRLEAG